MKAPDVEIETVVRIECMAERARGDWMRHRLEWGLRWEPVARARHRPGWIVSQRYGTRNAQGGRLYGWVDLFDVMIGGKDFARGFVMPWIYARADALVTGEDAGLVEPWQYIKGLSREERMGGKRGFHVAVLDAGDFEDRPGGHKGVLL